MPKRSLDLDEKDENIIKCLQLTPTLTVKEIAEKVGIPFSTAQKRVRQLLAHQIISRTAIEIDLAAAGYSLRYRVGIVIDPKELREAKGVPGGDRPDSQENLARYIVEKLSQKDEFKNEILIEDVFIIIGGDHDLIVDFRAKDHHIVGNFIISALRETPGVVTTTTSWLWWSYKNEHS